MNQRDVVREGYDEIAATYAAERDGAGRERALVERLASTLGDGSLVLDAGCGAGTPATEVLAERHDVPGLDISREQLRTARERVSSAGLVQGDLAHLPFGDGTFDAVVSYHAVIHVPREEHAAVFAEFERVLRPGGHLLVAVGAEAWAGENDDWLDTGERMAWSFHGADRNRELLTDAGFEITTVEEVPDELGGTFAIVRGRAL
ncbi:class I SAM-dependent methyltransferase [Haloarcula pellucida]|uniref:Methyltransferase type 11 n=1 Tax=Haloarcula pellucida TaxID=1427151 RepID=A0A830GIK2_9EURY|nr:class I SAM-dependent methyltransferase [Halomicroarcula pellucida]MBX0346818.1 class I SAM-dependent methyltransferase [Halomicroarcula pellucida]GGN85635.1 methyltransferase type 11 [Halomicroarcula pellucida]